MTKDKSSDKKGHLARIGRHGEHPYGDLGQIIILFGFLLIWILDSFVFKFSFFLTPYVPLYLRLIVAGLILVPAVYLVRSGHRAISDEVLSSPRLLNDGAFSCACTAPPLFGSTPVLCFPDCYNSVIDFFVFVYRHLYLLQLHRHVRRKFSRTEVRARLSRLQKKCPQVDSPTLIFFQNTSNLFCLLCV